MGQLLYLQFIFNHTGLTLLMKIQQKVNIHCADIDAL